VNPIITGVNLEPGQSFGNTWRFDGFSGHDQLSCVSQGRVKRIVNKTTPEHLSTILPNTLSSF
jgi:hypothetical protein